MPVDKCFSVLGSSLRLRIIEQLKERPMNVNELAEALGEERSNVSHSLAMLRNCNFVSSKKKGRQSIYSLGKSVVNDLKKTGTLLELMEAHMEQHCGKKCGPEEKK